MRNIAIAALVATVAVGGALGAFATSRTVETTANVEVTVWQRVSDGSLYLSTRPEGGSWTTHPTALDMSQLSLSGRFRQGRALTVAVPVSVVVEASETPATTPGDVGNWEHFLTGNVEGDLEGYLVGGEGGSYLYARCTNGTYLDVFITVPGTFSANGEFTYRFSEGSSGSEDVTFGRSSGVLGSTISSVFLAGTFVENLESVVGGSLYIGLSGGDYTFYGGFVINGLGGVREALPCWD